LLYRFFHIFKSSLPSIGLTLERQTAQTRRSQQGHQFHPRVCGCVRWANK